MPCAFMYTIQNHKRLHKTFYGFYVFYCISIKFIQKCCKNFNVNIFILFLVLSEISKKQKEIEPNIKIRLYFSGCGGRTRTCDLRVMSPTSYQLLYAAIFHFPNGIKSDGAGDRTRTGTVLLPRDFKSLVSTNSTTPADIGNN